MAHPNIDERRSAVFAIYRSGEILTSKTKRELAAQFNCSVTAIYSDWMSINQSLLGGLLTATPVMKRTISERDGGICQYCGYVAYLPVIEHIVPSSLGGPTKPENLVLACNACNVRKKNSIWIPTNFDSIASPQWKEDVYAMVAEAEAKRQAGKHEPKETKTMRFTTRCTRSEYDLYLQFKAKLDNERKQQQEEKK